MPIASSAHLLLPATTIHLFNGFQNPTGGSELEALALYELLRHDSDVHLWATSSRASPALLQRFPIRRISLLRRQVPHGGAYVFVGAHWRNKVWPYLVATPRRLIYIYNTFHPKIIGLTSQMPRALGWPATEYVLISAFQRTLLALPQTVQVHPSPIDIAVFTPSERPRNTPVVIGRMSRDTPDKHDPDDIALYQELARQGCAIHLQGATCIAESLAGVPAIVIGAEGQRPAADFLQGLDIFYYRSGVHVETFGRVVLEAMACGRPVVCHAHGGYAEHIRHGENGFLFTTTDQARSILAMLIADPARCATVGANARATAEKLYAPSASQQRLAFYRQ